MNKVNVLAPMLIPSTASGSPVSQYMTLIPRRARPTTIRPITAPPLKAMGKADISVQQEQSETFWSQWPGLQAVKNNKVYVIDSDMVLRLGPRLPQGIEMVGRRLYPDSTIKHNEEE